MKRARKPMEQQKPQVPEKRSPGQEPLVTKITVEELLSWREYRGKFVLEF